MRDPVLFVPSKIVTVHVVRAFRAVSSVPLSAIAADGVGADSGVSLLTLRAEHVVDTLVVELAAERASRA